MLFGTFAMTMQTNSAFDIAAIHTVLTGQSGARVGVQPDTTDRSTIRNERIKLASGFMNAIGLTLIAFALLRPVTQDISELTLLSFFWVSLGIGLHVCAHVVLGRLSNPDANGSDPEVAPQDPLHVPAASLARTGMK